MDLDPVLLSRIQFGLTVTFHIVFPTMSIGLAMLLTVVEALWLRTKDELYLRIYRFWLMIFAMGFGVGVVTGIVLSFEFGTNSATFARLAGPVIGPLIGLEVLTAFFLEAGFLGIMLFGMNRVGPKVHFASTFLVALGTTISASWILAANSWMQTPAGIEVQDGRFVVTDWMQVIFNPSNLYRLPHMLLAAYISAALLIAGVGAWYLLKREYLDFARRTFSMGTGLLSPIHRGPALHGRHDGRKDAPAAALKVPGDGGLLGSDADRTLSPGHCTRPRGANEPLSIRDPLSGEPVRRAQPTRNDARTGGDNAEQSTPDGRCLLCLPHNVPAWARTVCRSMHRHLLALASPPVRSPVVPEDDADPGACRSRGYGRWLVHGRDGPPAVGLLRAGPNG